MDYKKTTLKNGFRVITIPIKDSESVTTMVMVGAGSRLETERTNGISHFLEHMTFKGTEKRPTSFDISASIDGIGGDMNASTGKEETLFFVKAAKQHFDLATDVVADMVLNSKFETSEIEKEKGVIIEEINMYEDLPMRRVAEYFETLLYPNSKLGWDIAGTKEVIKEINRKDFIDYQERLYYPENMILVAAGGVIEAQTESLADKYFGSLQPRGTKREKPDEIFKQEKPELFIKNKKTDQTHIAIGVRANPLGHPDRYAETILAAILGGGMSSRLFIEVRCKHGLCYYVRTDIERFQDNGYLVTNAGVDTSRTELAIETILKEYQKLTKSNEVDQEELTRAKEFVKGRLVLELEDSRNVAVMYGAQELLENKIRTPEEMISGVEKVTSEDIARVATGFFTNDRLNLAVVGPFEISEKFQKLLKF